LILLRQTSPPRRRKVPAATGQPENPNNPNTLNSLNSFFVIAMPSAPG